MRCRAGTSRAAGHILTEEFRTQNWEIGSEEDHRAQKKTRACNETRVFQCVDCCEWTESWRNVHRDKSCRSSRVYRGDRTRESCLQQPTRKVKKVHGSPPFHWRSAVHGALIQVLPSRRGKPPPGFKSHKRLCGNQGTRNHTAESGEGSKKM